MTEFVVIFLSIKLIDYIRGIINERQSQESAEGGLEGF